MLYVMNNTECEVGEFTLSIADCSIEQGGIYSVVGPNGSGKSTLLSMLAFLQPPSKGALCFQGTDVSYSDSAGLVLLRRGVGYLMQNPYLFSKNVEENIGYGLDARGLSRSDVRSKVKSIMERMSLSHLAGRDARELSGGESQRVALARTLVLETDVVLLDEPTASVDSSSVRAVEKAVLEICRERNATLILTTHSMDQAYRMSTNLLSIVNGRIHGIAYENVFEGTVAKRSAGVHAVDVAEDVSFLFAGSADRERVSIAIESEDILLSNEKLSSSALNTFHGTISRVDATDVGLRVFVDVGVNLCSVLTRMSFEKMDLGVGKPVWLAFKASSVKIL
jgi:tungstate transport system ATP-binding protein